MAGLAIAAVTGAWYLKQIYIYAYFPLYFAILVLGALGILPRVRPSTKGEGTERRYFYGSVWAVTLAQALLMVLWKVLPRGHMADILKLVVYADLAGAVGARGSIRIAASHLPYPSRRVDGRRLAAEARALS